MFLILVLVISLVTSPNNEENIHNIIEDLGFRSWTIGEVVL